MHKLRIVGLGSRMIIWPVVWDAASSTGQCCLHPNSCVVLSSPCLTEKPTEILALWSHTHSTLNWYLSDVSYVLCLLANRYQARLAHFNGAFNVCWCRLVYSTFTTSLQFTVLKKKKSSGKSRRSRGRKIGGSAISLSAEQQNEAALPILEWM